MHRRFRYGVQVNSLGLTEAQPENNVQRIVLPAASASACRPASATVDRHLAGGRRALFAGAATASVRQSQEHAPWPPVVKICWFSRTTSSANFSRTVGGAGR